MEVQAQRGNLKLQAAVHLPCGGEGSWGMHLMDTHTNTLIIEYIYGLTNLFICTATGYAHRFYCYTHMDSSK